jgi:hypothetical protein
MMKDIDIDILALSIRSAVERECQGFTVGYKESVVIAAHILSGQQGGAVPAEDLPSVEALAQSLYETDVMSGSVMPWTKLLQIEQAQDTDGVARMAAQVTASVLRSYRVRAAKIRARLAEQPAPAGTGDADRVEGDHQGLPEDAYEMMRRLYAEKGGLPAPKLVAAVASYRKWERESGANRVEGLRPGIERALEIVEVERETVSVSSSAYQRLWSVRNALRDALDGASSQGEG